MMIVVYELGLIVYALEAYKKAYQQQEEKSAGQGDTNTIMRIVLL